MTAEILRLRPRMQLTVVDTAGREPCDITIFPTVKRTAPLRGTHPRPVAATGEAVAAGTRTSGPAPRRSTSPEAVTIGPVSTADVEDGARAALMDLISRALHAQWDGTFGSTAVLNVAVHMWGWSGYSYVTALARYMACRYWVDVVQHPGGSRAVAAGGPR